MSFQTHLLGNTKGDSLQNVLDALFHATKINGDWTNRADNSLFKLVNMLYVLH